MAFVGLISIKLDSKGRVVIPAKFRKKAEYKTIFLSKVNVFNKSVIAVFPTYECARKSLGFYFDFSSENYDRNLSVVTSEFTMDSAYRVNIGKLLDDREEKEMIAVGRCEYFELWYRSDFEDYCESENLQFNL